MVTGVINAPTRGYTALQVGAGLPRLRNVNRAAAGHFSKLGIAPRIVLGEFRVTPDALLPVGTPILARHFVPGQMIKVTGTSQGKGFQGAMKRHGFSGQGASHGNSVSHRALGATGCRQDPGKVIKGKKMPGHMGEETITMDVKVYKIDIKSNLIYVKGSVPGKPGEFETTSKRDPPCSPSPSPDPNFIHEMRYGSPPHVLPLPPLFSIDRQGRISASPTLCAHRTRRRPRSRRTNSQRTNPSRSQSGLPARTSRLRMSCG